MIPVVENGALQGVITDRDLVLRCIAKRKSDSLKASDIMTGNPVTGHPEMSVTKSF
jgi:CBS domain-containing protein